MWENHEQNMTARVHGGASNGELCRRDVMNRTVRVHWGGLRVHQMENCADVT